jgi:SAM-dependent methyltransferase
MDLSVSSALDYCHSYQAYGLNAVEYGLTQCPDGSLAVKSNPPAYVLGEQLRCLADKVCDLLAPIFSSHLVEEEYVPSLNWKDRPLELRSHIDRSFKKLLETDEITWGLYTGNYELPHFICFMNEYEAMKQAIQESSGDRKDFYALDIGSGHFGWVRGFARYINSQKDLPEDVTVHIIGVRGERYHGEEIAIEGRTKSYLLGGFKVEELAEKFEERGLDLTNKVDIMTSHWCFRHLVDPVGTFTQAYHLLRPGSGIFTITDFDFLHPKAISIDSSIVDLFKTIKAPFATYLGTTLGSHHHFLLQRTDDSLLKLPLKYADVRCSDDIKRRQQVESGCITSFDAIEEGLEPWSTPLQKVNKCLHTNDIDFYEKMIEKKIIRPTSLCTF